MSRISVTVVLDDALTAHAAHYNHMERSLHADMMKPREDGTIGTTAMSFKKSYLKEYHLTGRQFNAIGNNLEGKISSMLKLLKSRKNGIETSIKKILKSIKSLTPKKTKKS